MKGNSPDTVVELAGKFRLLQSSFADDSPELRKRTLDEELERFLKTVPFAKRKECLEALAEEFPVPESGEIRSSSLPHSSSMALPDDPNLVVDHLLTLTRGMAPDQLAAISTRLQNGGLLPHGGSFTLDVPEELQEQIEKFVPAQNLDATRALRSLSILLEFTTNLDQLVWQVWKSIAPKSVIQHETGTYREFRKTLVAYLTGDSEVSREQIKQIVSKTRKLISGLMAAMGTVGEIHAAKFLDRLSPEVIKTAAERESGNYLASIETKCWRRYTNIYNELNREAVEKEILDAIRRYTEKLVLGSEAVSTLEE